MVLNMPFRPVSFVQRVVWPSHMNPPMCRYLFQVLEECKLNCKTVASRMQVALCEELGVQLADHHRVLCKYGGSIDLRVG